MKAKEQLFQAGVLSSAAFHAGKPSSPASDHDFLEFLRDCGSRDVGFTPTGEAPTLELLSAWLRHWRQASESKARPARIEVASFSHHRSTPCVPKNDAPPNSSIRPLQDASSPVND